MPNPLAQAGATVEPSEYSALSMDAQFTGLWTQRSPLRDADVPYLYRKFYSASRFDSMIDGINREITAKLTDARRAGSSVYNSSIIPPVSRYYSFHHFTANQEQISLIADCKPAQNLLQNPNVDPPGTGWTYQTGWVAGTGAPFTPAQGLAQYTGPGTAAVINNNHIPATPGTVVTASCMAVGEIGASGTAQLEISWYDSTGTLIGLPAHSNPITNNYIWIQQTVTATAPAGTSYATVRYAVYSSTSGGPRWGCTLFSAIYGTTTASTVRDVTGPSNNIILRTKAAGAGTTTFLGINNILYGADGVETWKMVTSSKVWLPTTLNQTGDYIIDPNGNIQLAMGSQTANVIAVKVDNNPPTGKFVTLFFDPSTPLDIEDNIALTLSGLTTVPSLNGTTPYTAVVVSSLQVGFAGLFTGVPVTPYSTETGTATTGSGVSAGTPPTTWNTTTGLVTQDGGEQWVNRGTNMQNWGGAGPTTAPTVTQIPAATLYPAWAPSTWYAPSGGFVIFDGANFQLLTTAGTTGAAHPTWATTVGATTSEVSPGTAVWTCKGTGSWVAGATHAVGDLVVVTFTYYTTQQIWEPSIQRYITQTVATTVTAMFTCIVAGVSQTSGTPSWTNGLGTKTVEGSVTWSNGGNPPTWPGASQTLSLASTIVDTLGNIQTAQKLGESGAAGSPPTWQTAQGASTSDNSGAIIWLNNGPYSPANTGPWQWAYSGLNSITGEITNPSPISKPLIVGLDMSAVVQGLGLADPQFDQIILWRTAQKGATLFYVDQFANPGANQTWIYTDTVPDNALNTEMAAPGSVSTSALATPVPSTAVAPEYHYGRIFMIDGPYVIYSGGPDTIVGAGNSSFPPLNFWQLPEQPIKLKSVTTSGGGLLVICIGNTYVIQGDGTSSNPFLPPKMFMEGVGILSYDCFVMRGSTCYALSNKSKCFSFDPGNGEIEIGFPIGDQFKEVTTGGITAALYNPATAYVTWHEQDSTDTGLYVSDGAVGWFRWSPISPPESGSLWSPRAVIGPGTSAVQSVEVTPGVFKLLIGPAVGGPILFRDNTVKGDWNGTAYAGYPSWDVKGSIGLCETGEVAEIVHIALKSIAVGARPTVSLLLDEIAAGVTVEGQITAWDTLSLDEGHHEDPPNLDPSITMFSDRYKASSTAITPKCESFQMMIDYGTQQEPDELLKFGVFGATFKERRQQ